MHVSLKEESGGIDMTMNVKELKEKLGEMSDDMPVIALLGKERLDGDIVDIYIEDKGDVAILEVNI